MVQTPNFRDSVTRFRKYVDNSEIIQNAFFRKMISYWVYLNGYTRELQ